MELRLRPDHLICSGQIVYDPVCILQLIFREGGGKRHYFTTGIFSRFYAADGVLDHDRPLGGDAAHGGADAHPQGHGGGFKQLGERGSSFGLSGEGAK